MLPAAHRGAPQVQERSRTVLSNGSPIAATPRSHSASHRLASPCPEQSGLTFGEVLNTIIDVFLKPLRCECLSTRHVALTRSRGNNTLKEAGKPLRGKPRLFV